MKLTKAFFKEIKDLIHSARATVARGVDLVQVYTNFEIGRRIVDQEQKGKGRAEYGQEVIKALADRLTEEFGMGFSARNLASMKAFYLQYQDRRQILQTPSAKFIPKSIVESTTGQSDTRPFTLSWSHYVFLLSVKNADERLALSRDKAGIRKFIEWGNEVGGVK